MKRTCDNFHRLYEKNRVWEKTTWMGSPIWKFPFDAFIIQELIYNVKPDYVIETGTNFGGSALFYASILELMKHGHVISVDIADKVSLSTKNHDLYKRRIIQVIGDSTDEDVFKTVASQVGSARCLVILDSWHSKEHVLAELTLYSRLVPTGSYIIVEDSHVSGHPIKWKYGEGPYEAIQEFLEQNHTFAVDKRCEKLLITFNPSGYLKKALDG